MLPLEPILYIDDEPINLESFKLFFWEDFQVFTADSAYEAYKILANNEIKVVITDQRMPEITGIELLEVIKEKYPDITRILLTAFIQEEYLLEAINRGAVYRYITKPWNHIELGAVIKSAIENYNLKAENKQLIVQLKEKIGLLTLSEEKFRNIFNSSKEGILILDANYKIINANKALTEISGFTLDESMNKHITNFVIPEYRELLMERLAHLTNGNNNEFTEYKSITRSGNTIYVEVKSSNIEYEGAPAYIIVLHDVTERKQFEKKLYIAQVNAEEKERERIAKELHDGIGPLLSTLKIYLFDIQGSSINNEQAASANKMGEIINDSITTVKEISNNISPHVLRNFGIAQAIKSFVDRLNINPGLKFHLHSNLNFRIDDFIEITLYRIVTELINNTIKHANADNVNIAILVNQNSLSISYKDNGIGIDIDMLNQLNKGFGLQNIKSRVKSIGGKLNYSSKPGKGINVEIIVNI